jgi:hypothetical protein
VVLLLLKIPVAPHFDYNVPWWIDGFIILSPVDVFQSILKHSEKISSVFIGHLISMNILCRKEE